MLIMDESSASNGKQPAESSADRRLGPALAQVQDALRGLRYGQVTITVQDGVIVQIDRLERTRLQRSAE